MTSRDTVLHSIYSMFHDASVFKFETTVNYIIHLLWFNWSWS